MDSDSVGLSASPPSRSRLCIICGPSGGENKHYVYLVDIVIDESSLGDAHKIPPRAEPPSPDSVEMDLSAFEETTPDLVLVDFPTIHVCALDSLLCFFPIDPSTEVLYLDLPKSLNPHGAVYGEDGSVVKKARLSRDPEEVGYDKVKKAPLKLVSPKAIPSVIRYGTRFLVFSTAIRVGISPDSPGDQLEIYHPLSEQPLKDLPNLIIHGNPLDGYEFYNLATKSFEPLYRSRNERITYVYVKSYTLMGQWFVLRTDLGMFILDLENPTDKGWLRFLDGDSIMPGYGYGAGQIHVAPNGMKLEGICVYKNEVDGHGPLLCSCLPASFISVPVRQKVTPKLRYCGVDVALLDDFNNYPRFNPCLLHLLCQNGVGSYMILDVVRADLSRFGLENEEWAEIIHSFNFFTKRKVGDFIHYFLMLPI